MSQSQESLKISRWEVSASDRIQCTKKQAMGKTTGKKRWRMVVPSLS